MPVSEMPGSSISVIRISLAEVVAGKNLLAGMPADCVRNKRKHA
jgi:hypothetical protein